MLVPDIEPHLEGLVLHDPELVIAKLGQFAMDGIDQLHVVSDWDRTATANGRGRDITSWGVMQSLLPPEAQQADQDWFELYHPKEKDGTLTEAEAVQWWQDSLRLHVEHKTNIHDMERAVREVGMRPRDGAVDQYDEEGTLIEEGIFNQCDRLEIPTIVLSAGVENVITWVAKAYKMNPTLALATHLWEAGGHVTGWDEETLIHCLNKHEKGHKELSAIRKHRPNTLLLGDDGKDPRMVEGDKNVVRVQVTDYEPTEEFKEASIGAGYDAIVVGSLLPVVGIVRYLAQYDPAQRAHLL